MPVYSPVILDFEDHADALQGPEEIEIAISQFRPGQKADLIPPRIGFVAAKNTRDTVAENAAVSGGGLFATGTGAFSLRNTIVALYLEGASGFGPDLFGVFTSQGHNLIGDGTGTTGFSNTDLVGTTASPIDPLLGLLKNHGGPTATLALKSGSPAIDHGDSVGLPAPDAAAAISITHSLLWAGWACISRSWIPPSCRFDQSGICLAVQSTARRHKNLVTRESGGIWAGAI